MQTRSTMKAAKSIAAGLFAATAAASAFAQAPSNAQGLLDNRFVFSGGAFLVGTDVNARLDGSTGRNRDVDFEQAFGDASDETRGRVDALWRINPAHHLRFMYFNNSVTRRKTLDRTVEWGDATYQVGANVEAETKMTVYELAYEYAFLRAPSYELAATLGVHYTDLSLRISGNATVNGVPNTFESRSSSLPAPLPVVGLRGGWVVAPNWYLDARAQLFKLKIDGYDGNWWDLGAGATWMFSRNFGVGLGYSRFTTRVDVDRTNFSGHLKTGYSGLQAYLTGTF